MRINLPGSTKTKIIVLLILTIISFGVLINEGIKNRARIEKEKRLQEQLIKEKEKSEEEQKIREELEKKRVEEFNKEYEQAYIAFFSRKYEDAITIADSIIKKDSRFYKAYNIRGIAKAYKGNFEQGMNDIDKSLELKKDFGYGRFNKALTYELFGHYDEAIKWYNKALEIEEYEWSYYGIASIYGRRGDVDNTINYLKKAIEIEPKVKEEAKIEADFNPVRNSKKFIELVEK
ncbi:hypothetical protein CPJCM30710_26000 [Clostridium polyendosporum]|uniref:Tetratricopeptide repeat-containing protein n=1 Tax=Clostridium polyendosporum TaxID=69208 RepID=A0A919S143_9CLOT|nr:hypothetical protein [Clostridium polyendosporum]GIM29934.1 hypothetical protein CPJCM30710_26000 [Clostridium polyendosporum]